MMGTVFIWVVWLASHWNHPLYLSNTAIKYKADKQVLSVRFQIFESDLQEVLFMGHGVNITDTDNPQLQSFINQYIAENCKIWVDGKLRQDLVFIKRSPQYDAIILEYEIRKLPTEPKNIKAEITFLLELFPEQTNIVSIFLGGQKKTFPLKEYNIIAELKL